ncbi:hypothetical protein LEP1GSC036_3948 [Leptospira weilii str. 2006001853]|uniref:Uncharacterized protein n=1 Tax=Leptospira weilii str. 2006001853 TaxID=1001589 RepID=A0A828Z7Z5_9LEPT|nr:hypothetical protein LEP1GSC036_3948 [Leptospira weilii str. 2006001853]EMN43398.1 hypothetical protein LEP1GSC086_1711 [Leptospira weilii str. LNT 1234]
MKIRKSRIRWNTRRLTKIHFFKNPNLFFIVCFSLINSNSIDSENSFEASGQSRNF